MVYERAFLEQKFRFGGRFFERKILGLCLREYFFGGSVICFLGDFLVSSTALRDTSSKAVKFRLKNVLE